MIDDYLLEELLRRNRTVNIDSYGNPIPEMTPSPQFNTMINNLASSNPSPPIPSYPQQRIDPETVGKVFPSAVRSRQSSNINIPLGERIRSNIAGSNAAWSNFFGGLGRRGRNFRANPMAPEMARSAVINDYVNRRNAAEQLRQSQEMNDLRKRQIEASLRPKPVDPIEQAQALMNLRKSGLEAQIKQRELEQAGKETEYKQALVDQINSSGKVAENAASMAMSLNTLESMAKDIGLDPLKLKRAKAIGGIRTGDAVYRKNVPAQFNVEVPSAFETQVKYLDELGDYLPSWAKKALLRSVEDPNMSPKDKENTVKEMKDLAYSNYNKEKAGAEDIVKQLRRLKGTDLPAFNTALKVARNTIKDAGTSDWNRWKSAFRLNEAGMLAVDGLNALSNDPKVKDLAATIATLEETYGRGQSGAAIAETEWRNFRRQLGTGAFTSLSDLYRGVARMISNIRQRTKDAWDTVHWKMREEYEEQGKLEGWLPKVPSERDVNKFNSLSKE